MALDLQSLQRSLAQLVRNGRYTENWAGPTIAAYLSTVASSTGLRVMRQIASDWRQLLLRRACPLTSGALLAEGLFVTTIEQFVLEVPIPPLVQELSARFLERVADSRRDSTGSLARFEKALIAVRRGTSASTVVIAWKCDPLDVIASALQGVSGPKQHLTDMFTTEIAAEFPAGFIIRDVATQAIVQKLPVETIGAQIILDDHVKIH